MNTMEDKYKPSYCAIQTENGKGLRSFRRGYYAVGCNERDETDPVTHEPVGRGIARGFEMMDDGDNSQ